MNKSVTPTMSEDTSLEVKYHLDLFLNFENLFFHGTIFV